MSKIYRLVFLIAVCSAMVCPPALAQKGRSDLSFSPRNQLATIVFTGLGGAVLGLSTLSFYGRPQDHLENIGTGFAVGIILGTGFVTYKVLTVSQVDPFRLIDDSQLNLQAQFSATPLQWKWQF